MNLNNFKEELVKFVLDENDYEVGTVLGQGAFGFVYQAIELSTDTIVAIKQVSLDTVGAHSWNCITQQISVLCQCQHPSIIQLRGFFYNEQQNRLSMVMPMLKTDLLTWLRECHRRLEELPISEKIIVEETLIQVIYQIASAETYLLENFSLMHRDIKPENILVGDDNNEFVLTDFDICEKVSEGKHIIIGASAFFPPEIMTAFKNEDKYAEFDLEKADVFALGSVALGFILLNFVNQFKKQFLINFLLKELISVDKMKRLQNKYLINQQLLTKKQKNYYFKCFKQIQKSDQSLAKQCSRLNKQLTKESKRKVKGQLYNLKMKIQKQ